MMAKRSRTTGDLYTIVTSCAASARRSSVWLSVRSLVNQALRGLQPPLLAEPEALAPGSEDATILLFDLTEKVTVILVSLAVWLALDLVPLWPALVMRQGAQLGTIEAGKLADVIVVKGNVLENLNNLQHVTHVIKGGKVYK